MLGPYLFRDRSIHRIHPWAILGANRTTSGQLIDRTLATGVFLSGPRNLELDIQLHWGDQIRGALKLFDQQYRELLLSISPTRWFDRLILEARWGDDVDFTHDRRGRGGEEARSPISASS